MLNGTKEYYWAMFAFWTGKKCVFDAYRDTPKLSHCARQRSKECARMILKYRTSAVIVEDREANNEAR